MEQNRPAMTPIATSFIMALCATLPWFAASALAQGTTSNYPAKPIRYIVPFAPSGTGDVCARFHAQRLQERLGQPVVVDNRPGANEVIGIEAAVKSAPDGYTILQGSISGMAINMVLSTSASDKLPYDSLRDLAPISMVCSSPLYLAVNASVPARTLQELVALAKSNPGKLTYGSIGVGSTLHLATALFADRMKIDLVHVPYKSGAQVTLDLTTGLVDMYFGGSLLLPQAKAGKVRVLASGGLKRTGATPEVPTMDESGVPNFDVTAWFGLVAPAAVPRPIIQRLYRETEAILRPGASREGIANNDVELLSSTPEEFGERIRAEIEVWTKVVRSAGIKAN